MCQGREMSHGWQESWSQAEHAKSFRTAGQSSRAGAMIALLGDRGRGKTMVRCGREKAEGEYRVELVLEWGLRFYAQSLDRGKGR